MPHLRLLVVQSAAVLAMTLSAPVFAQTTGRFPDPPSDGGAQPQPQSQPSAGSFEPPSAAPAPPPAQPAPWATTPQPGMTPPSPSWSPAPAPELQRPSPGVGFYPAALPYVEGQPVPDGYRLDSSSNTGLMVGGLLTLLAGYGAAFVVASGNDFENGTQWLVVPVIGPWGALASRENPCAGIDVMNAEIEDAECIEKALDEAQLIAFLTVDGIAQVVGATLFLIGAASREKVLLRNDIAGVHLAPSGLGRRALGLTATGQF
jgi:hypothetical protein